MPSYYNLIEGWFDFENLYGDLLLNKKCLDFVEVGVWKGKSVCFLAELMKENNISGIIYAVDIFSNDLDNHSMAYTVTKNTESNYTHFLRSMKSANVLDVINPIAMFSEDAATLFDDNSFDCVFIDASHDKESVFSDVKAWYPKVKKGGYFCGHDYEGGIKPFIDEYFEVKLNGAKVTPYPPHCFIYQKP